MAKSKLPFVVQPRLKPVVEVVGSEESGQIEIERRGYLTVAEKSFVQGAMAGENALTELHQLSIRLARKSGLEQQKVFRIMTGMDKDENDLLLPYESEIASALTALLAYQEKNKLVIAACLLINRVNPDIEIEDVMSIHPDLVDDLVVLYNDEEAKSTEILEKAAEEEPAAAAEEGKE